jgi:hypothetical protein
MPIIPKNIPRIICTNKPAYIFSRNVVTKREERNNNSIPIGREIEKKFFTNAGINVSNNTKKLR